MIFFTLNAYVQCISHIIDMSSELEVLKQRIIELEAKNAEIPDLRRRSQSSMLRELILEESSQCLILK